MQLTKWKSVCNLKTIHLVILFSKNRSNMSKGAPVGKGIPFFSIMMLLCSDIHPVINVLNAWRLLCPWLKFLMLGHFSSSWEPISDTDWVVYYLCDLSRLDHLCELAKVSKFWSKAAQHCSPTACPRTRQYIDAETGDWTSNLLNSRQLALKPEPHWQPISFFKWQLASSKLRSTSTLIHLWIIFPVIFSCSCSSTYTVPSWPSRVSLQRRQFCFQHTSLWIYIFLKF